MIEIVTRRHVDAFGSIASSSADCPFKTACRTTTAPSEHPAWRTIDSLGGKLINGTLIGYGIHEAAGVVNNAVDKAGNKYEASGENSTISHSSNSVTGEGTINNEAAPASTAAAATSVNPTHLSDCSTTTTGAATSGEFSSCMTDYGYSADVISGLGYGLAK